MKQFLQEISISSGFTQAKIAPFRGGLLTSFCINEFEILYLDKETFLDLTKNVRGGIPLLFPNAGPSKGWLYNLPQHGFVRRMPWHVSSQNNDALTLHLVSNAETKKYFPFEFDLILKVTVSENKITHTLTVINTSDKPMPTAYGTHPYFKIAQDEKRSLVTNIAEFYPKEINWHEEFDQSFVNPGSIHVQMPGKELILDNDPAVFKFVRIWHLSGKDFICIEPWTRDSFAIDDPEQSLWINPHESQNLSISIQIEINDG